MEHDLCDRGLRGPLRRGRDHERLKNTQEDGNFHFHNIQGASNRRAPGSVNAAGKLRQKW